jgi:hypothetical protein
MILLIELSQIVILSKIMTIVVKLKFLILDIYKDMYHSSNLERNQIILKNLKTKANTILKLIKSTIVWDQIITL